MIVHPDLRQQHALDRQERLLADAAASRLAGSVPTRTRVALVLRRTADRLDAATAASTPVGRPLTERS